MSVLDKFLNAMKLNDEDDNADDDGYLDDDVRDFDEEEDHGGRRVIRSRDDEDDDDDIPSAGSTSQPRSSWRSSRDRNRSEGTAREGEEDDRDRGRSGQDQRSRNTSSGASKISPIRGKRSREEAGMEVCVIRPHSMEDAREITQTLLAGCTVVLNLEGLELEIAQRIIDFASGSCFAIDGNLQKISSYIFIITPSTVEISGDFQDLVSGAFDVPFEKSY